LKLWEAAPTPADALRLRASQVEKLLKGHRIRRIGVAEVIGVLKQAALTVAPGVTEAAVAHIRVLIASIRLFAKQLKESHRQLGKLCQLLAGPGSCEDGSTEPEQEQAQRAIAILQSLPGTGRIVLAVLLAEAFDVLQRADYAILRVLCGVAPVTRRSGKSCAVTRRLACNPRLRNAIHHLADAARRCDEKSKAKYLALRARGCSHARALRTVVTAYFTSRAPCLRTENLSILASKRKNALENRWEVPGRRMTPPRLASLTASLLFPLAPKEETWPPTSQWAAFGLSRKWRDIF